MERGDPAADEDVGEVSPIAALATDGSSNDDALDMLNTGCNRGTNRRMHTVTCEDDEKENVDRNVVLSDRENRALDELEKL